MQENCLFGSEGGAKLSFVPTPIQIWPIAIAGVRQGQISESLGECPLSPSATNSVVFAHRCIFSKS